MGYKLLKYQDNWADEMNVDGVYVFENIEECNKFKENIKLIKFEIEEVEGIEFYIGTNESITYDAHHLIEDSYDVIEINEAEYMVLKKLNLETRGFAVDFVNWVLEFECEE